MATVKLTKVLIIVIAVSGLVGCLVILFLVYRCCRRPKSTPLPPIQPLAHHKEKELNHPPHPRIPHNNAGLAHLGRYESDTSLLKPSCNPSFQTDESQGTSSSGHHSILVPPSPSTNVTHQSSPPPTEPQSDEPSTTRPARSTSRNRPRQPRSRVDSIVSIHSNSAHTSTRSPNTFRGAPHSTLSNVQIVLPTPLAPQLQSHMVTTPSAVGSHENLVERGGIADGWTPTPSRTTSRRANSKQDLLTQDASRGRKTSSNPGHHYRRSLDTMDQPKVSEPQTQFRGRSSSNRSIQPQPLGNGDTTLSPGSLDNRTRPPRTVLQKPRNGQGNTMTTSLRYFPLNLFNPQPDNHPLKEGLGLPAVRKSTRSHVPTNRRAIPQPFRSLNLHQTHSILIPSRRMWIPSLTTQLTVAYHFHPYQHCLSLRLNLPRLAGSIPPPNQRILIEPLPERSAAKSTSKSNTYSTQHRDHNLL